MQWWLIGYLPIGGPAKYVPFQGTRAQAQAQANLAVNGTLNGPYTSKPDAQAAIKGLPASLQQTPTGAEQAVGQAAKKATGGLLKGLEAIGDFFQRLTQANTWIRAGEVVVGLILLAAGLARITHAVPAATRVARAVGTKGLA